MTPFSLLVATVDELADVIDLIRAFNHVLKLELDKAFNQVLALVKHVVVQSQLGLQLRDLHRLKIDLLPIAVFIAVDHVLLIRILDNVHKFLLITRLLIGRCLIGVRRALLFDTNSLIRPCLHHGLERRQAVTLAFCGSLVRCVFFNFNSWCEASAEVLGQLLPLRNFVAPYQFNRDSIRQLKLELLRGEPLIDDHVNGVALCIFI